METGQMTTVFQAFPEGFATPKEVSGALVLSESSGPRRRETPVVRITATSPTAI